MIEQEEIVSKVAGAREASEVLNVFDHLAEYEDDTRVRLLSKGFDRLAELKYPLSTDWALELCFAPSEKDRFRAQREVLTWLYRSPFEEREVKKNWIDAFVNTLTTDTDLQKRLAAIWMLQSIGSRDESAVRQLEKIVGLNSPSIESPDLQEAAFCALAWLAYEDEEALTQCLLSYLTNTEKPGIPALKAVGMIASPTFLPQLAACLKMYIANRGIVEEVAHALANIAFRHPEFSDDTWAILVATINEHVTTALTFWADVSTQFNSTQVVETYLKLLILTTGDVEKHADDTPNWYIYNRIGALPCPKQVESLLSTNLRANASIVEAIRDDACGDTRNEGKWQSMPTKVKAMSWDIALRLNLQNALSWFPAAFAETNRFTKRELCKFAGYTRAVTALPTLRDLVSDPNTEVGLGIEALEALGCYGSSDAATILLGNCIAMDRFPPMAVRDSLAYVCYDLGDCSTLVQHLLDDNERPITRLACAAALELYASFSPEQASLYKDELLLQAKHWAYSNDEITNSALNYLISAIGFLDIDRSAADFVASLAKNKNLDHERVCETLARRGFLADKPELMLSAGLVQQDGHWTLSQASMRRSAFILTLLYHADPENFSSAIAEAISSDHSYRAPTDILDFLGEQEAPDALIIEDAVATRAHRVDDPRKYEIDVLEALTRMNPQRIASEFTYTECRDWYWPAREALASCLHQAGMNTNARAQAITTLTEMLTDGVYTVRRLVARALGEIDAQKLQQSCLDLLEEENPQLRQYAAEIVSWLPDEEAYRTLYWRTSHDPEASVRIKARVADKDRVNRAHSACYLEKTLGIMGDAILPVWAFGQALRNVGDDSTAEELQDAARKPSYPTNVRMWLFSLAEGVEERWKKIMEDRNRNEVSRE